jgi:queuine tRNA-ribosyltransferase
MTSDPIFRVVATDGRARAGQLVTPHGTIDTPVFMPVGTLGSVKALLHRDLESLGAPIILGNTYHLFLRPGDARVAQHGGLHRFIGWNGAILTDSGGFQIFSLSGRRTIREEGAEFQSHLDGSAHLLTPERTVDIQARLGSDVAMVLDECLAYPATRDEAASSMRRSARWAGRCRSRLDRLRSAGDAEVTVTNPGQAQFGVRVNAPRQSIRPCKFRSISSLPSLACLLRLTRLHLYSRLRPLRAFA